MAELQNRARFAPRRRVLLEVELIRLSTPGFNAAPAQYAAPAAQAAPAQYVQPTARPAAPDRTQEAAAVSVQDMERAAVKPAAQPAAPQSIPQTARPADPAQTEAGRQESLSHIGEKLETVKQNWDMLLGSLTAANRVLFVNTVLKEARGGILVVFRRKIEFDIAAKNPENGLIRLKALCMERLGININFLARVALPGEFPEEEAVITDEDLSKINFPVNIQG